jgi:hypothetical protein
MAMHNTNSLLKYVAIPTLTITFLCILISLFHHKDSVPTYKNIKLAAVKNIASSDSAAESLDTLTADLSKTKEKISEVSKNNEILKQQNASLLAEMQAKQSTSTSALSFELNKLKNQMQGLTKGEPSAKDLAFAKPITVVDDLSQASKSHSVMSLLNNKSSSLLPSQLHQTEDIKKPEIIPYYTIPANGTSVRDKLMTALVGRIPIKGIVTDPYPFKIVISDDNLAANGLRIPHLLQMIVSGYCEGDLNLMSVRGWVTSLTFVFDDGTISSTTSNDNDIGNFTKANSLGYLSDQYGNPFIRGKLITNAPSYLAGNVALGAGVGAANAYGQSQTTNSSYMGGSSSSVTGSPGKFIAGQAMSNAATGVQQWWHDREEQSFDAVYVSPSDDKGNDIQIAVNFAKEIHIDYDPKGRKLNYAHNSDSHLTSQLD